MSNLTLVPEFQAMADALAQAPAINTLAIADARGMWSAFLIGEPEPIGAITDQEVSGAQGSLAARLYMPEEHPAGIVLFLHGGGWVLGDLETHDIAVTGLVRRSGLAVLSVEYRLAPEAPFPAGLDDAMAALRWLETNRERLGVQHAPLIVCGDSAGGNLAAALAIKARNCGGPIIDGQVLIYPVTDGRRCLPSYSERGSGGLLSADDMAWFWDHYAPGASALDPLASPLLCPTLADLPPAVVITAEFDPLRDEGRQYAADLSRAGVRCVTIHCDNLPHGFLTAYQISAAATTAVGKIGAAMRALAEERMDDMA